MKLFLALVGISVVGVMAGYSTTKLEFLRTQELFLFSRTFQGESETLTQSSKNPLESGQPKLVVVGGDIHDFGAMGKKEEGEHSFEFRNEGTAPLQIKLVRTSCKCTWQDKKEQVIEPGATGQITLLWRSNDYSPIFAQTADLQTNDPENEFIQLRVRGKVIQDVRPFPNEVVMSNVSSSRGISTVVRVYAYRSHDLKVTDFQLLNSATQDFFDVRVEPMADDSEELTGESGAMSGAIVHLTMKPGMPLGQIYQTLSLDTNLPDVDPIHVPIRGSIEGDISVSPSSSKVKFNRERGELDLGIVRQRQGASAELTLVVKGEHAGNVTMEIDSESIDPAQVLTAEIKESRKVGKVQLVKLLISIPPGSALESRQGPDPKEMGRITVKTSHPTSKKITVYVRFVVVGSL